MHAPVCPATQFVNRQPFTIGGPENGEIPAQQIHMQASSAFQQPLQELAQSERCLMGSIIAKQSQPAVDIPRENKNGALRTGNDGSKRAEITFTINQKTDTIGVLDAPAITTGLENTDRRPG
jgi:hypothetical protein